MPSSVDNIVGNTTVGANYLKARPSTRFATRQLAFYNVAVDNVHVDYTDADSLFSKAVRGVQLQAEIFAVGTPAAGNFVVVVAQDTTNDGAYLGGNPANENGLAQTLEVAIESSTGVGTTVTAKHLEGTGLVGGLNTYEAE